MTTSTTVDEERNGYNVPAWVYDVRGFFIFQLVYRDSLLRTVDLFTRNISHGPGDRHLEVAVGSGSFARMCMWPRRRRARGDMFDYEPRMLAGAQKKFGSSGRWNVTEASVEQLPYETGSFTSINCANAFHCFPDAPRAAVELARVLDVQRGVLLVNVVVPPSGFGKSVASSILTWGRRNNIVNEPIAESHLVEMFSTAGLHVVRRRRSGNQVCLWMMRSSV